MAQEERRKFLRLPVDLPLEYRMMNGSLAHGGLAVNVSEMGLLITSIRSLPVGTKLGIAVLFPKGFELANFEVLAEVVWRDLYWEEDWEGYRYGLKFVRVFEEDHLKLKQLLGGQFQLEESSYIV